MGLGEMGSEDPPVRNLHGACPVNLPYLFVGIRMNWCTSRVQAQHKMRQRLSLKTATFDRTSMYVDWVRKRRLDGQLYLRALWRPTRRGREATCALRYLRRRA